MMKIHFQATDIAYLTAVNSRYFTVKKEKRNPISYCLFL
jgi:hypothetical protein